MPSELKSFEHDLESFKADPSKYNLNGNPPLHALVRIVVAQDSREKKQKLMVLLLRVIHIYVNLRNKHGLTVLHVAVQLHDIDSVKTLLVFGADVNALTLQNKTPLDLIVAPPPRHKRRLKHGASRDLETLLSSKSASTSIAKFLEIENVLKLYGGHSSKYCNLISGEICLSVRRRSTVYEIQYKVDPSQYMDQLAKRFFSGQAKVKALLASIRRCPELRSGDALALTEEFKKMETLKEGGSRILVLDGGGFGGLLIQLEVLMELERETGQKVSQLFDWIIGTSAGSLIATGNAVGVSLPNIRKLGYDSMETWFGQGVLGLGVDIETMERDFKSWFGDTLMSSIKHPNILIPAVNKSTSRLQLHIFNNCFGDEFSSQPIWKVVRYTTSAPGVVIEKDDYVDGGLLANNPSECGLTRIQSHYNQRSEKLPISLVVSIGSGQKKTKKLGSVNLQSFASHLLHRDLGATIKSFSSVVLNAIVQTETSAANTKSRCEDTVPQIPFHRFNVDLDVDIALVETKILNLMTMLVEVRRQILTTPEFSELVKQLRRYPAAKQRAVKLLKSAD